MGVEVLTHGRMTWINIEKPTPQDMDHLRQQYPHFHPLDLEDLQFVDDGLKITIRRSKTDQDGAGRTVAAQDPGQRS